MKQKIYILGIITAQVIFLGAIFKVNHWPGAAHMLTLGMIALIMVFLPLALRNHFNTEGNRQFRPLYIVTWLTCLVVFGGMLFKILHWPGAGIALMLALPFPYVVFLPVFLVVTSKIKNYSIYNTVYVLFLLTGISVVSALLALNVHKERIDDSFRLSQGYNRMEVTLDSAPVKQTAVTQKIDDVLKLVDEYQYLILREEGITEEQWNKDQWQLRGPEKAQVSSPALLTGDKESPIDTRLETSLSDLIKTLEASPGYEELAKAAPSIFDFVEPSEEFNAWTYMMFKENPQSWVLIYLDGLETNLKTIKAVL